MASPASAAVRFLAGSKKAPQGILQLRLHVKPGASKNREGIQAVTDDVIELCVAAQAKDGEANQAVIEVLSEALDIPKSKLVLAQGARSRDKTVVVQDIKGDGTTYANTILELLHKASSEAS
ncbi:hypothetical protein THAR02_00155 [Trichoderma harzianum]|uniref:Uncharacterized protein n=3 Tax=Trichoderma TaxID=5543 RepID=A0A0G0A6H0_TRIHA|nr:hypothetical protein CFAM422_011710 [Trichoderma lentiforme]KAK4074105.1 hypothetical protein Trihar35433_3579 [Trichoderma harzianum]KKP07767.1 hypothetical protein THAR02_00155 [Trichoderma harzianum]QYS96351.1 hypothetical protein H0G86_003602 [Trichoderma simmonsii]